MDERVAVLLKEKCSKDSFDKIALLKNEKLHKFIADYVELCEPDCVYVCDDSAEDKAFILNETIKNGEESRLAIEGHAIHFDGFNDQARDKNNTRYLFSSEKDLASGLNSIKKDEGIAELNVLFKGIMRGKTMYVLFSCLGPTGSEFSIPCIQLTDSSYVCHSEYVLYRRGYEQFKNIGGSDDFFRFIHSAGELENGVSKNVDKRRVYMDLDENIVYSINTQYAGNTCGLKKCALRLAIKKASEEGWLAEHMFLMGVHGPNNRKTYFTGAFPSACGKTSTSMLPGESIMGDDIAYLRKREDSLYAVNVESGIFGIIGDVSKKNDPRIWDVLTTPKEVIFCNVLVGEDNNPYWLGDGREIPDKGINYSGEWTKGKKDDKAKEISHAHKNARYTVKLEDLENVDSELNNPEGVKVQGIIYGGRDSSVNPPVQESFSWSHGIITMGASIESETTAATLGQEGVRKINPMSNLDFVSLPLGVYINNNLKIVHGIDERPKIFSVNYFQKDKNGKYLTGMEDKRVWVKWMELRVHGDVSAIETPTGNIPKYDDLKKLFMEVLNVEYSESQYCRQFKVRVDENLAKIERVKAFFEKASEVPEILFDELSEQKERLEKAMQEYGPCVEPMIFQNVVK